jgi:hypothetical protein
MSLPGALGGSMHDGICEPFWQRTVSRLMHRRSRHLISRRRDGN